MRLLLRSWYSSSALRRVSYSVYGRSKQNLQDISISEAEKVVGYPTPFLNLKWLLSSEIVNITFHFRKLLGTNHTLLSIARNLILNNEKPSWGLLVLLVSKAGGYNKSFMDVDEDKIAGILHTQRMVAEVVEMVKISNSLHRGLVIIDHNSSDVLEMQVGNKAALLCGDYLLSNSYQQLADIKNLVVNELISSALRDLSENEFIGPRDRNNKPLPNRPKSQKNEPYIPNSFGITPSSFAHFLGHAKSEWILRSTLGGATLLGKACKGVLLLAGYDEDFQMKGYLLGKYLALSLEATRDYKSVFSEKKLSPVSAPMLFHLQRYPKFYSTFQPLINRESNINDGDIRSKLQQSPALGDTVLLQNELCEKTLSVLESFRNCEAKIALQNIVHSVKLHSL